MNDALRQLEPLVGDWDVTLTHAWFLESLDTEIHGTATVEWYADAFLLLRGEFPAARPRRAAPPGGWRSPGTTRATLRCALPRRPRRLPGLRLDLRRRRVDARFARTRTSTSGW